MRSTSAIKAWQTENSCTFRPGGHELVVQFPGGTSLALLHFLDGIPDVHHYVIANRDLLLLDEIQAHLAPDAFCLAKRVKAIDIDYLHWNAQAHEIIVGQVSCEFKRACITSV